MVPSNPSEAEAFQNFLGERGFANAGESCEGESQKRYCACIRDMKVGCSLMCVSERSFVLVNRGKVVYSCLFICFLSHNVGILLTLLLKFSSMFAEYETEKAKQGLHPEHLSKEGRVDAFSIWLNLLTWIF